MGCARLLLVVLYAAVVAPAATAAPLASLPASAVAPARVFVLDLVPNGVDAATVATINGVVSSLVSECPGATSVNSAELRSLSSIEASRQSAGCAEGSCLGELASALGARFIVAGDVGRLGATYVVNLTLFDAEHTASRGRSTVELSSLDGVSRELRPAVNELLTSLGGIPLRAHELSPLVPVGGTVLGLGVTTAAVGGVVALFANSVADTPTQTVQVKRDAIDRGRLMLLVAAAGGVVTLAGGGVLLAGVLSE